MIYVLLDNYDYGLEIAVVEDFDELAKYLKKMKEVGDTYTRIQQVIIGEEIPWNVITTYYNIEE